MKFYLTLILLLSYTIQSFSQNEFSYNSIAEYSLIWQPDSTNIKSRIMTEKYNLYISDKKSFFISSNRIGIDTLLYKNSDLSNINALMSLPQPTSNKRILKYRYNGTFVIFNDISSNLFQYKDEVKFNWKLEKDTIHIANIIAKKATTFFRGRKYIAWYSESIPISDGPYKFYGLPGLIIKIYDTKKHFQYELLNFKHLHNNKKLFMDYLRNSSKITKEKFNSILDKFIINPIPLMESEGAVFTEETKRIIKERFKKRNNSNNNPMELDNK